MSHEEVHLVLLDMHMPRLTGLETIQRVKQLKSRLPCILISAGLDERLVRRACSPKHFPCCRSQSLGSKSPRLCSRPSMRTYNWDVTACPRQDTASAQRPAEYLG